MFLDADVSAVAPGRPAAARAKFSTADDAKLMAAVRRLGTSNWTAVAAEVGTRNARQCRDRWRNYLNPDLIPHSPWTEEEDAILVTQAGEMGSRWIAMVQFFPTRSVNDLKNRYRLLQRVNTSFRRRRNHGAAKEPIASPSSSDAESESAEDPFQFLEELRPEFDREFAFGLGTAWDLSWMQPQ